MTSTFFVSHHGDDLNYCGNWTMPCRTVRHAVKMINDGDEIYIDYAQGKPYMECENPRQSTYSQSIELTKSVSFYGINGKAEIRCTKWSDLFMIKSPSLNKTRVKFLNLVISNSNIAVRLDVGTKSEVVFQNMLVRNNHIGLYSKYSTDCSILITNSSFEHNFPGGTRLKCFNVTVHLISSTFKFAPVLFANIGDKSPRWQNMRIWVRSTVVDGENTQLCAEMFAIQPFAATLNVTIIDSQFKNHLANCRTSDRISTLHIYGHNSIIQMNLNIFLSNLLIENNYNNWATLTLAPGYQYSTKVGVIIRDTVFRNNSAALRVIPYHTGKSRVKRATLFFENNTFVDNIYKLLRPSAAAIYFENGNSRVSSCRFFDNKAGRNLYTGVVTISKTASVTFLNSHFENRQTKVQSNQLFASGDRRVQFIGYNTFNLVALKEGQSVFIRIPSAINAGVIIKKNFKIFCPKGYTINPQRSCAGIKNAIMCYYINVRCEQCPTKTYTLQRGELIFNTSNNIQCQQCPRGGDCDSGLVTAKPTFWGYKSKMKVRFVQCPPGYCCESEDCVTYDSCHGNRSGTICGQCPEGMSESLFSTQCISNTKCSLNYFFILGVVALIVLYLLFFLYQKEILSFLRTSLFSKLLSSSISRRTEQGNTDANTSSSSGMIKIFFYYYQVCNLLRSSVGSSKRGEFLHNFEDAISRVMNMVVINLPSFNCPLKNLRPVPKIVILHSVGYCLLGLLFLLHLLNKLFVMSRRLKRCSDRRTSLQYIAARSNQTNSASKSSFSKRLLSAFTYISLLMYASSAQLCLSLLHCVPVGEDQVIFLDGNIKCYQTFQYFLLAYVISSILPFCLVPILGSYLLKCGRIGVKQFCAACIFPLPFCCFWMYLLLKTSRCGNQAPIQQNNNVERDERRNNDTESLGSEDISFACTDGNEATSERCESAILGVLLGPFRPHQAFVCFPASRIPWEGFLIFRRLVLIIVLTFVYDFQLKLFLALTLCVAILIFHMFVNPFQRKCDNILESFSLGAHVVLCCLTLLRALYYGQDYSFSKSLPLLNVIEKILIVAPLSVIVIVVIVCIVVKLAFGLRFCVSVFIRNVRRLVRFTV